MAMVFRTNADLRFFRMIDIMSPAWGARHASLCRFMFDFSAF
jgi:hypothetical protein